VPRKTKSLLSRATTHYAHSVYQTSLSMLAKRGRG